MTAGPTLVDPSLRDWLRRWRRRKAYLRCYEAVEEGRRLFPDLRAVHGVAMTAPAPETLAALERHRTFREWVNTAGGRPGLATHWWLVGPAGVVDPTLHQFRQVGWAGVYTYAPAPGVAWAWSRYPDMCPTCWAHAYRDAAGSRVCACGRGVAGWLRGFVGDAAEPVRVES